MHTLLTNSLHQLSVLSYYVRSRGCKERREQGNLKLTPREHSLKLINSNDVYYINVNNIWYLLHNSCSKLWQNGLRSPDLSGAQRNCVTLSQHHCVTRPYQSISSGINISNGQSLSVSSLSSNQWHCCQATTIMCRGFESTLLISSYSVTQHSEFVLCSTIYMKF